MRFCDPALLDVHFPDVKSNTAQPLLMDDANAAKATLSYPFVNCGRICFSYMC